MLTLCPAAYTMLEPLPGLENYHSFEIESAAEYDPFLFMVASDDTNVALTLVDPFLVKNDYSPALTKDHLKRFPAQEDGDTVAIYVVVANGPEGLGVNLAAPILFHQASRQAIQILLDDPNLPLFTPIEKPPC